MPNDNMPPPPQAEMIDSEKPLGFDSADEIGPAINMRDWVRDACEAKGAKMVGGGIGFGQCDIDIDLDGYRYNLSIKAIKR
jgi:hypothetical protein